MYYNHHMIVFDTSTMILLAKIDILELFISSFHGKALAPRKVKEEVCQGESEETPFIVQLITDKKINVLEVENRKLIHKLMEDFPIDVGEAEAIVLALQEKASLVATDDRNAIRACKLLKMEFTTAIAVLMRTFEKGLLDKEEALLKLQKLESIARYGKTIIEDARKEIEKEV